MLARWGIPSPAFALAGKETDPGVTNIRNTGSPHWCRWLGVEDRDFLLVDLHDRVLCCGGYRSDGETST